MPPRHQTLPAAQTSSARAAMQSFYCELCSKGYSRMNDYEAHLGSYDHSHRQRMKDMKQMVKDPTAGARARKAEAKADGLISIKLGDAGAGAPTAPPTGSNTSGGFKKGGFKKSGFKSSFAPAASGASDDQQSAKQAATLPAPDNATKPNTTAIQNESIESDTDDDEKHDLYDPRYPTD